MSLTAKKDMVTALEWRLLRRAYIRVLPTLSIFAYCVFYIIRHWDAVVTYIQGVVL